MTFGVYFYTEPAPPVEVESAQPMERA